MVSIGSKDDCKAYVDVNFYQYLRKQLSAEESAQLEAHTKICMHCLRRAGLFSEALTNQTSLDTNEKIFFLTFLESELWEIISTELKEEFLGEVQATISKQLKEEIAGELRVEIRKDIEKTIQLLTKEENVKKIKESITQHWFSRIPRLSPVRQIILAVIAATLITSLGLAIFSLFEQRGDLTKSPVKYHLVNPKGNLYKELDDLIDKFLDTNDQKFLKIAQQTAAQIKDKHNDNYGLDLINYYLATGKEQNRKNSNLRKELNELNSVEVTDNYEFVMTKAQKIVQEFLLLGNIIESYKAKILVVKACTLTQNPNYMQLQRDFALDGINYSEKNNYLFLQVYFSLWQAKILTKTEMRVKLEKTLILNQLVKIDDVEISAGFSLAALYEQENKNKEALELATKILEMNPKKYNHRVTLLQISGMAAFKLDKYKDAENYFTEAINLARANNSGVLTALTYSFYATLLSNKKEFQYAALLLQKAENSLTNIKDDFPRKALLLRINGYRAKNELLQGS